MAANMVSEKRRNAARKHASRSHTCVCGRVIRGNGGWSSHKKACPAWQAARGEQA